MPSVATRDRTSLFYQDWGVGRPVVFVTGWGLTSAMWQYQMIDMVEQGLRCVAYDRRGHGRSDQPGHGYDLDTLADDLATLIEHLDLREATLVGHSMGGAEIVRYLSRHGADRVDRVALVAAATPVHLKAADNPAGVERSDIEATCAAMRRDFPRFLVDIAPPFFGDGLPGCSLSPEIKEWTIKDCHRTSLKAAVDCYRSHIEADLRPEVRAVTVPTLVVHGDKDVSEPIDMTARQTARLLPDGRLTVYENAPHGLYLTHRDRLTRDLVDFIKG